MPSETEEEALCHVGITIIAAIRTSISNLARDGGDFFGLAGKRTLRSSKKSEMFWSGDCGDWKRSLKSFGRRRQRSAIEIARTKLG
jgi:hypothetical protein